MPRIPAWKRLGLELKNSEPERFERAGTDSAMRNQSTTERQKRKSVQYQGESLPKKIKGLRSRDNSTSDSTKHPTTPLLKRRKSVTFTPETKTEDGDSIKKLFNTWVAERNPEDFSPPAPSDLASSVPTTPVIEEGVDAAVDESGRKAKKAKRSPSEADRKSKKLSSTKDSKPAQEHLRPFIAYLQHYHDSRETWKFNKNHQNNLLKHIFDVGVVPSKYAHILYTYVQGLQGVVRTRLRDAAFAVQVQDKEEGEKGFPKDITDAAARQKEYEAIMNEHQANVAGEDISTAVGYEEQILRKFSEDAMVTRAVKRMRAEQILAELGTPEAQGDEEKANGTIYPEPVGDEESQKRVRMNDGTAQKVRRKRKQRTSAVDDSSSSSSSSSDDSSSSSDSDSDDSTSSSGSDSGSDDSSDDTDTTSSSSSASSDSDSDSDSDSQSESDREDVEDTSEESESE